MSDKCQECGLDIESVRLSGERIIKIKNRKKCLKCLPIRNVNRNKLTPEQRISNGENKVCNKCKLEKPLSDFYFKKEMYAFEQCKKCCNKKSAQNNKLSKRRIKEACVLYKGGCCQICGYKECFAALDFHHLNPDEKDFTIGDKWVKFEKLTDELDKCILLCSNCHRELHGGIFELPNE